MATKNNIVAHKGFEPSFQSKVDVPNLVINLHHTPILSGVWLGVVPKMDNQNNMCLKMIATLPS